MLMPGIIEIGKIVTKNSKKFIRGLEILVKC